MIPDSGFQPFYRVHPFQNGTDNFDIGTYERGLTVSIFVKGEQVHSERILIEEINAGLKETTHYKATEFSKSITKEIDGQIVSGKIVWEGREKVSVTWDGERIPQAIW